MASNCSDSMAQHPVSLSLDWPKVTAVFCTCKNEAERLMLKEIPDSSVQDCEIQTCL